MDPFGRMYPFPQQAQQPSLSQLRNGYPMYGQGGGAIGNAPRMNAPPKTYDGRSAPETSIEWDVPQQAQQGGGWGWGKVGQSELVRALMGR